MYFQHNTGQIREMQLREGDPGNNEWEGGNSSDWVVDAKNAKNGTPIAAVSYAIRSKSAVSIQRSFETVAY